MRHRGFTTTELMVVIVIIGILAAITAPSFPGLVASLRMNAATREIASKLQLARVKAIAQNTSVRINFDPDANTYQLQLRDPATQLWRDIETVQPLPSGVTFQSITGNPITFQSGRGSTEPGNNGTVTLQNVQGKRAEVVVGQTGRVIVRKY